MMRSTPFSPLVLATLSLLLCLPSAAAGAEPRCELSFAQGSFDVCRGESRFAAGPLSGLDADLDDASPYRVLKLDRPPTAADRARIEAAGAEILGYLPHHAYLLRRGERPLPALDGLIWQGALRPRWKVGPSIDFLLAHGSPLDPLPVTAALYPGAEAAPALDWARQLEGVEAARIEEGGRESRLVLALDAERLGPLVERLARREEVASIGLRRPMRTTNAAADWLHQSGVDDQTPVFDQGIFGCGETVGVLDSGIDFSHCAFYDSTLGDPPISDCATGASCPVGTPDPAQRKMLLYYKWSGGGDGLGDAACDGAGGGHGTHVAGSVAGEDPTATTVDCAAFTTSGDDPLDGTAPGARLIGQEMGGGLEYVNSLGGTIYHAATTAYQNGARIHSNSWGGGCCFLGILCLLCSEVAYDSFARDADAAVWDFPELALTIAAGNDGGCCSAPASIGSPGIAKNAITVGATQHGSSADGLASFSSRGWTNDRRTKPDVVAQGQSVISTASDGSAAATGCSSCSYSGTSMSTPTTAGLAALVREYLRRGFYPSGAENAADALPTPSAALVKALLVGGATDIGGVAAAAPNQDEGWGRVHLDDSLYFAGDARGLWLGDDTTGVDTGETAEQQLEVAAGQPLRVTLVWSDPPATVNANPSLVNDLRLEVVAPGGAVWTQKLPAGNPPDPFADTATTGYDDRNTVEQVKIAAPATGTYTLRVRGVAVPMGPQPYALAATGGLSAFDPEPLFDDGFESGDVTLWSAIFP